jgi:dihydrofolate reductase
MAQLVYTANTSLDGFIEDEQGSLDWSEPDEEVFRFITELERPHGSYLYGRRMYETMVYWESVETAGLSPMARDFTRMWQKAEKIVYSRTLEKPASARTRIAAEFDPDAVRRLKESAPSDLTIAGAELAGQALAAGLVDEVRLFVVPVLLGGGKRALQTGVRTRLELVGERPFHNHTIYLRYRVLNRG